MECCGAKGRLTYLNGRQDIVWGYSVHGYRVNVWSCTSSVPYTSMLCTGQLNVTFIRLYTYCHGTYWCVIWWLYFTSFIGNLKSVCFLFIIEYCNFKNNVRFLTVWSCWTCLTYQLLSCTNFVVSVIETDGQWERVSSGWFSGGRNGFLQSRNRSKTSNCISCNFCWPGCSSV
jgi:hypothetical protein